MYKLLLVTDREEVLNAFNQVTNWEMYGFKQPHFRNSYDGMLDSLQKHHADGIAISMTDHEEEERILAYLQANYPAVSIFEAGTTQEEIFRYLNELKTLLNRIHADFSNDRISEADLLQQCRHEFLRKVITGKISDEAELRRSMRLLRSKMDADSPCLILEIEQSAMRDGRLEGRWTFGDNRLEKALRYAFGGNYFGMHIFPAVYPNGRIVVLVCPLHGDEHPLSESKMEEAVTSHISDGINHLKQYQGIDLHITNIRVLPALTAFCGDTNE